MTLFACTVMSENDHGYEAGRYVAARALAAFDAAPPTGMVAVVSNQYQQPADVVRGIRSLSGDIPLIGCCAPALLTTAGLVPKGVGVLAVRADGLSPALAFEPGFARAPGAALERATAACIPADATSDATSDVRAVALVFGSGLDGDAAAALAMDTALSQATAQVGPRGVLLGAVAMGGVFVNDTFADDGVAVALVRWPSAVGVGVDAVGPTAADGAVAALDGATVAAVLAVDGRSQPAATDERAADAERLRERVGRVVPFLGFVGAGAFAAAGGPVAFEREVVLVGAVGG